MFPAPPARACSGPTCDSADVLYEDVMVELPLALAEGDQVRFHCAGAYTATYSTAGFSCWCWSGTGTATARTGP